MYALFTYTISTFIRKYETQTHFPHFTDTEPEERDINPISKQSSSLGLLPFPESQKIFSDLFVFAKSLPSCSFHLWLYSSLLFESFH